MSDILEPYTKVTTGRLVQYYRHDGVCYAQHFRPADTRYENPLGAAIPKPDNDTHEPFQMIQPHDLLQSPLTDEQLHGMSGLFRAVVAIHLGELSWETSIEDVIRRKALKSKTYKLVDIVWGVVGYDDEGHTIHVSVVANIA
ncbi:MAG: hypothetical protein P4L33_02670 [Capsulimonadaceae bacterium]|nr:hypothetical protein [Capsulimonadaceae bacterium]